MKELIIAALVTGQLLAVTPPAYAAELSDSRTQEMGAFGGLRVRVPLDGTARERQVRAGLTVAPTLHGRDLRGNSQVRIGEGLELGVTGRQPPRLLIAGQDVRLGAAQDDDNEEDEDRGGGPSTLGWIAIGAGVAVLATFAFGYWVYKEAGDCDPGEC